MIKIDGSLGEGGGQILRTALGLSLVTQKPFEITNIRANRKKPGLLRQHLTSVKAAKEISKADVSGDAMKSTKLIFKPNKVISGDYHFAVGTAGSATLVLQTILPGLIMADATSNISIEGGTHNPFAPPFNFLKYSFLPILKKMGVDVKVELIKYGFYPAGGGKFQVSINPSSQLIPVEILERGDMKRIEAKAYIANLNENIGKRELNTIQNKLPDVGHNVEIVNVENSQGPGNIVTIKIIYENIIEIITGFGKFHKRAEKVASEAVDMAKKYISSGVPVGEHLADQLMIPFSLAGKGAFMTMPLSRHSDTNKGIVMMFCDVNINVEENEKQQCCVRFD